MNRVVRLLPWAEWRAPVQALMQAAYAEEARLLGVDRFPPAMRQLDECETNEFYGVVEDAELVGVIELERSETTMIVASLAVHPSRFRQGVARELINWLRSSTPLSIELTTAAGNAPARALYRALRLREQGLESTPEGIELVRYTSG